MHVSASHDCRSEDVSVLPAIIPKLELSNIVKLERSNANDETAFCQQTREAWRNLTLHAQRAFGGGFPAYSAAGVAFFSLAAALVAFLAASRAALAAGVSIFSAIRADLPRRSRR